MFCDMKDVTDYLQWLPVPGFPGYEVNGNKEVRSLKRGRIVMKKLRGKSLIISVDDENKVKHSISWVRFYFCAVRQIDPRKIKDKGVFISIQDGEFQVETLKERIRTIRLMPSYRKVPLTLEEIEARYIENKAFMDIVLDFYHTGKGEKLTSFLYGMKNEVDFYMSYCLRVLDGGVREELFSEAVDRLVVAIQKKDRTIYSPHTFIYKTIRILVRGIREMNSQIKKTE